MLHWKDVEIKLVLNLWIYLLLFEKWSSMMLLHLSSNMVMQATVPHLIRAGCELCKMDLNRLLGWQLTFFFQWTDPPHFAIPNKIKAVYGQISLIIQKGWNSSDNLITQVNTMVVVHEFWNKWDHATTF